MKFMIAEKQLQDILPIMGIEHDCILSRQGDVTVAFKLSLPEIFTLSGQEYELLHQSWLRAIRVLPAGTTLHKQDWFIQRQFTAGRGAQKPSFLTQSADRYFEGRTYLGHDCYLMLTKRPEGRKPSSSIFSNLVRPSLVPQDGLSPHALAEFLDTTGRFKHLLEDSRLIQAQRLTSGDLLSHSKKAGLIERYCYLLPGDDQWLYKDIQLRDGLCIAHSG